MRDLASRLRAIVRQESRAGANVNGHTAPEAPPEVRALTYVPLAAAERDDAASSVDSRTGAGVDVIDTVYAGDRSHGRRRIESCLLQPGAPLQLFDPRLSPEADWHRRVVFFDIETTGLSGGAGTVAFLAGCGWFEGSDFLVRQFFLGTPSAEAEMLDVLGRTIAGASLLVTYNGRTFDVPFMETRWAFHRTSSPAGDLPHFDMLPAARRLWSRREHDHGDAGCSLTTLEREVLGVYRVGDVPGFEIPVRYFQYLRTGDRRHVDGVLEHNRQDIVSLAVLTSYALWLAEEGPDACREPGEQLALGRLYARAGQVDRATAAFERAAHAGADADTRRQALAHIATSLRRARRYEEAARHWQQVLELAPGHGEPWSSLDRRAAEALAIHHEHRSKDIEAARRYAARLEPQASGAFRRDLERRVTRIERKLRGKSLNEKLSL